MPSKITLFKDPPSKVPLGFTGSVDETGKDMTHPINLLYPP